MKVEYQFLINDRLVTPLYKDDVSKDYEIQSGQIFFRKNLNGNITLNLTDYDWLDSQPFDTKFILNIQRKKAGVFEDYHSGTFCKTDVKWDVDHRTCEIKVNVYDNYVDILAGYEKEFNLIELAPGVNDLTISKRPVIQAYVLGSDTMSCYLGGTYWEQPTAKVIDVAGDMAAYHFALNTQLFEFSILTTVLAGIYVGSPTLDTNIYRSDSLYYLKVVEITGTNFKVSIFKTSDDSEQAYDYYYDNILIQDSYTVPLSHGTVCEGYSHLYKIYMRYVLDVDIIETLPTYDIPTDDILANNLNYRKCIGYGVTGVAWISGRTISTATKYGKNDYGNYFVEPYTIYGAKFYPLCRSMWVNSSLWFNFALFDYVLEEDGRKDYILKDVHYLNDVIRVLLAEIAPGITHDETSDYSEFLYSTNPITFQTFKIMMTQKSNVLHGEYDKAAQKATITMRDVMNMLRDCFQCYWWIDETSKLRIEHISYFKNGGTYTGVPTIEYDLTAMLESRNKKPLSYMNGNYEFDKLIMNQYYQFHWMDDTVSLGFSGYPIEIQSNYVEPGKNEDITIQLFTTDIDYMLLNTGNVSEDGFALFSAINVSGVMKLPFVSRTVDGASLILQNGYMSWITLHPNYWVNNLPAKTVKMNNEDYSFYLTGIQKLKKQTVQFPSENDPDPMKLIKTSLGDGQIEKISVNLSSRMNKVILRYDTE